METSTDLYISLLKKTLSFSLWPEPPAPYGAFRRRKGPLAEAVIAGVTKIFAGRGLVIGIDRRLSAEAREGGEAWPGYADTMVGMKRLDNIDACVRTVIAEGVPGDFIETGVWRGGSCILMRGILKAHDVTDRRVFVADSFEGLPPPEEGKYPADAGDKHHRYGFLAVSEEQVRENFRRYGLLDEQVVFLKGFFEDTLPDAPIDQLAILRLDGDMYSSTIQALESLYDKLSVGGFCIIDDYALAPCAKAVEDFRTARGITDPLETIDNISKFWRKT
ncbi:O-methyltransferase [Jannaschia pohangensis]|uniref:O-methyltransferase n=2 Tax=Jannaschia pohangensis TaxID=390807 RepID=A0A1I3LQ25_9RHOB|nr:O-methyltransferase [Jannaschia pohangensis]